MTDVVLIYPYVAPPKDRSIFRFPPLGLGYIAATLRRAGVGVEIVDCTFLTEKMGVEEARRRKPKITGIYSMFTMREAALRMARLLREDTDLLVAGGPMPSTAPELFLDDFDVVVRGEGEKTILELLEIVEQGKSLAGVMGLAYRDPIRSSPQEAPNQGKVILTEPRPFVEELDSIPPPERGLFPNEDYKRYWQGLGDIPKTSIITTRGCPFNCEFCSNAIFGVSYRERSAANVVDEVESVLKLGYEGVWFADDVFTLNAKRVGAICDEIERRGLDFCWECLSRANPLGGELLRKMRGAGCRRLFFGLESGSEEVLGLMKKRISLDSARESIRNAVGAGIKVGAFFIVGYPGETEETILQTLRYSASLPLDYVGFTLPYPIPGTPLYDRVADQVKGEWRRPRFNFIDHILTYDGDFSEGKLKFAIAKGQLKFEMKRRMGGYFRLVEGPYDKITDSIFRMLK